MTIRELMFSHPEFKFKICDKLQLEHINRKQDSVVV